MPRTSGPRVAKKTRRAKPSSVSTRKPAGARKAVLLDVRQTAAVSRFNQQFCEHRGRAAGFVRRAAAGLLSARVAGLSPAVARAITGVLTHMYSSVDGHAAPNVDHLAAVFGKVLEDVRSSGTRPLGQAVVNRLAVETVLTDALCKGRSPTELAQMPLAPIYSAQSGVPIANCGSAFWEHARQATKKRPLADGLAGVLMHGIPAFEPVRQAAVRAGLLRQAPEIYAAVLGHHMAGFIADHFHRADIRVDFGALADAGALTPADAKVLTALYDAAIALAATWRRRIDTGPLNEGERTRYRTDARGLRAVIKRLPAGVRAQLINDDLAQFTPVGMGKWLVLFGARAKSNGALIDAVYAQAVQPYYEESIARQVGRRFEQATRLVAQRLGMTLEKTAGALGGMYRPARPGEPAFAMLAAGIRADTQLLPQWAAESHRMPRPGDAANMVAWFRARPAVPTDVERLAHPDGI